MSLRRTLAVAAVATVSVGLVGCIQLPTAAPVASPPPATSAAPTSAAPTPSETPAETTPAGDGGSVEGDALGPYTVDDGAGDTWTYTVSGYENPAPLVSGTVPDGMVAISLLLDATHDAGSATWGTCFDITFVGSQGTYSVGDPAAQAVLAENDIYAGVSDSFTDGRAVLVVPGSETVDGSYFVVTSRYGDSEQTFPLQ